MKTELSLEIPHDLLAPAKEVIANLQKDQANPNYHPMIYICAPYTAVVINNRKVIRQVENYCRFVYECCCNPNCPQHYLPRFLNLRNYNELNAAVFMDIVWNIPYFCDHYGKDYFDRRASYRQTSPWPLRRFTAQEGGTSELRRV